MKRPFLFVLAIIFLLMCTACLFSCSKAPSSEIETTTPEPNQTTAPPDTDTQATSEDEPVVEVPTVDVWNGYSSSVFASGDGSFADPYRITTCAELAYLANLVKSGASFEGKYLSLEADLDLNAHEWIQIGTHTHPFMGNFDGNGHIISNLKITNTVKHTASDIYFAYAGLFANCRNANISNLNLKGVTVNISSSIRYDRVYVGGLVGYVDCDPGDLTPVASVIKNVKLSDVNITVAQKFAKMFVGGCVGFVRVDKYASFEANAIQSYTELICNDNEFYNYLGGIIGYVQCANIAEMSNFASYASVKWPYQKGENYSAAIGAVCASNSNIVMSEIFSKLQLTREWFNNCYAAAVVAEFYRYVTNDEADPPHGAYRFCNVFGSVTNYKYDHYNNSWGLGIDAAISSEINCARLSALPTTHGFSEEIWDLSSLSEPTLK